MPMLHLPQETFSGCSGEKAQAAHEDQTTINYQHGGFQGNLPGLKNSWVVNPGSQWFGSQTMANCQLGPDCHIEAQEKHIIPETWGGKDCFNFVAKTKQDNGNQNENLFMGIEAHWGAESYTLWSDSSQEIIIGYISHHDFN